MRESLLPHTYISSNFLCRVVSPNEPITHQFRHLGFSTLFSYLKLLVIPDILLTQLYFKCNFKFYLRIFILLMLYLLITSQPFDLSLLKFCFKQIISGMFLFMDTRHSLIFTFFFRDGYFTEAILPDP